MVVGIVVISSFDNYVIIRIICSEPRFVLPLPVAGLACRTIGVTANGTPVLPFSAGLYVRPAIGWLTSQGTYVLLWHVADAYAIMASHAQHLLKWWLRRCRLRRSDGLLTSELGRC